MSLPIGVELLLAPNPSIMTGPGTNTFLISAQPGKGALVIDPGPDDAHHLTRIAEAAERHGGLRGIIVTHAHPDHAEGAAPLRERTGAPIYAWSREDLPADHLLADNSTLQLGERVIRALHTPGHRFDHLCLLLEDAAALFAGDLVAGVGTVVIAPPEGDMLDYLASLHRLLQIDLAVILPAHGPQIDQPRALLEQYIAHRNDRERQVLAVLTSGPASVADLVTRIYVDVDPALHPLAAQSVTAHLFKLEREYRVARERAADGTEIWRLQG